MFKDKQQLIYTLITLEFILIFLVFRNVMHIPLNFFVASDDGYYNGGIVKSFGIFNLGPGWMNYAIIKWYKLFPSYFHPIIALFYRLVFYTLTLAMVQKLFARGKTEKLLASIVFLFPLLFYYVFKPASELFIMPLLAVLIFQLAYDKVKRWQDIVLFCLLFFIVMQFKPILVTLAAFAFFSYLFKKRFIFAVVLIAITVGSFLSFKALSYDFTKEKSKRPFLSAMVFNSLRQKQIFQDIVLGKVKLQDPDYRAAIVRENTGAEMLEVLKQTGYTEKGVIKYLVKHPDLLLYQFVFNFFMVFGGVGRMGLALLLFAFNLGVFILTYILLRKGDKPHRTVFYYCLAYLAVFLLVLPNFRYTYTILPIVYFLFLSGISKYYLHHKGTKSTK